MTVEPKMPFAGTPEPQLPVLRFSLRQLFWMVTALSVAMAALMSTSGVALLASLLALLAVALHVSGTVIGSRLRAAADERREWEAWRSGGESSRSGRPQAVTLELSSHSPLHGRGLPLRRLPLWVAAGALVGGALGMAVLAAVIGDRTSAAGVAVGSMSTAVVGAWIAFLGASFGAILRAGWRDAVRDQGPDEVGRIRPR